MAAEETIITGITPAAAKSLADAMAGTGGGTSSSNPRGTEEEAMQDGIKTRKTETKAVKNSTVALKKFGQGLVDSAKGLKSAWDSIQQPLQKAIDEFKVSVETGTETFDGWTGYFERTLKSYKDLGVTLQELSKFNKVSRQASINLGGLASWTAKVSERQTEYYARIGDHAKALQHQAESLEALTHAGLGAADFFGPMGKNLMDINDDLLKLGVSYEESRELLKATMEDESVRHRLRAVTDKKQRQQIILETQGRLKNFKMLGMTTEQAKKASAALEELGGKKPLDRFKQAAKAQAALGAMGIEGAAEIGSIIRKGARATEEERQRVQEVFGSAQDIAAEAAMGPVGQEFFVTSLLEKTGMAEMMGKNGVFSTRLTEGAAVNKEQLEAIKLIGKDSPQLTAVVGSLEKILKFLNSSPILGALANAGSLGLLGAFILPGFIAWKAIDDLLTGEKKIWGLFEKFFGQDIAETTSNIIGPLADVGMALTGNTEAIERTAKVLQKNEVTRVESLKAADAATVKAITDAMKTGWDFVKDIFVDQAQAVPIQDPNMKRIADDMSKQVQLQQENNEIGKESTDAIKDSGLSAGSELSEIGQQ